MSDNDRSALKSRGELARFQLRAGILLRCFERVDRVFDQAFQLREGGANRRGDKDVGINPTYGCKVLAADKLLLRKFDWYLFPGDEAVDGHANCNNKRRKG